MQEVHTKNCLIILYRQIHNIFIGPMQTSAPVPGAYYGRPRSDGVVFSMAGLQDHGNRNYRMVIKKYYYHLPGDDPDAVTIDIMEDVSKMIYVALTNMANDTADHLK